MKKIAFLLLLPVMAMAQEKPAAVAPKQTGKYDTNKFSQMYDLLATPNMYRSASGAPGPAYYQQQADYKIDIDFRINIYVDDIYIEILNKEKANEIISSLIIHLEYYKLFINKNKTKADPNLNIECINNAIFSTDYYLGIPFTRDIKLYGKIILAELNKKIHVDWNDVYNILSDDNPTLYKSICTGFFSYKLKPLYMYYAKCNNNYNFDNDIIKQFIHDNYVIEEDTSEDPF
jgi:hypothetical protein